MENKQYSLCCIFVALPEAFVSNWSRYQTNGKSGNNSTSKNTNLSLKTIRSEPFLEELLLQEMSRANTDLVAGILSRDPERLAQAIAIVMRQEEPISRRAMWAIDIACEKNPGLITPYIKLLIIKMPEFRHDAFRRHILRIAARLPFHDSYKGALLNVCFDIIADSNKAIAVKANAMQILSRMAIEEPDIRHELKETIRYQMEEATPGFRSQARKVLNKVKELDTNTL